MTKLKAVGGTSEAPTLMQVQEIGTKYMVNSGYIQPVQDLIDQDKFDLSQWEENILSYYQIDGKLYSLPFSTSNAILIYNKDKFKAAGLDPESPPKTFGEIREMAKKLTDNSKMRKDSRCSSTDGSSSNCWPTKEPISWITAMDATVSPPSRCSIPRKASVSSSGSTI